MIIVWNIVIAIAIFCAGYAFCGLMSRNTILEEQHDINQNNDKASK